MSTSNSSKRPFEYHAPTPEQVSLIQAVRVAIADAHAVVQNVVPACAERTLAIRKLEEASMWANKAIVFNGEHYIT